MPRVVISWLAFNKDFIEQDNGRFQIKPAGPTTLIHEFQFPIKKYDTHILLQCNPGHNTELERKIKGMKQYLKDRYPSHNTEIRLLPIEENDLTNYEIVAANLRSFLQTLLKTDEIDVITGTGSAIMQMSWVALFYSMDLSFQLFLMHHNPTKYPDPIPLKLTKSIELDNKLKEVNLKKLPLSIVKDKSIENSYKKALTWAKATNINVLILGETGSGKDLLAKYIVKNSPLHDKPFEAINCASLPDDNLLYSELFGHEKGSFTGASDKREGLFLKCKGGTIFMDEIGDISYKLQVSLLRALENYEIKHLGSDEVIKNVNVRIISATNADLLEKCEKGQFRWDLYFRLKDAEVKLEPFRDRKLKDRIHLLNQYLNEYEIKWGRKLSFTTEVKKIFFEYEFPGNFREIKSTINSLYASSLEKISVDDLPELFFRKRAYSSTSLIENEKAHIEKIYKESRYIMDETARRLGYSNSYTLKQKMIRLGITLMKKNKIVN